MTNHHHHLVLVDLVDLVVDCGCLPLDTYWCYIFVILMNYPHKIFHHWKEMDCCTDASSSVHLHRTTYYTPQTDPKNPNYHPQLSVSRAEDGTVKELVLKVWMVQCLLSNIRKSCHIFQEVLICIVYSSVCIYGNCSSCRHKCH